jgi:hypothetical protein
LPSCPPAVPQEPSADRVFLKAYIKTIFEAGYYLFWTIGIFFTSSPNIYFSHKKDQKSIQLLKLSLELFEVGKVGAKKRS